MVNRYDFGGLMHSLFYEYNCLLREFSSKSGLYIGQPRILTMIKDNQGCTLSELSELMGVGMPSLSVSVRNMKKNGLIKADESRSRSKGLYLTEEGMKKAMDFHLLIDKFLADFLENLGPERGNTVNYEFEAMRNYINAYRENK